METQFKPGFNGTQGVASHGYNNSRTGFDGAQGAAGHGHGHNLRSSTSSSSLSSSRVQLTVHILRATAIILPFIAVIVMGTGKDTARVAIANPSTMQIRSFVETIKARYSPALVYFIVINVLMFLYSASSLAVSLIIKGSSRNLELALTIADLLFLILLFSSNGAAITTSITIEHGNLHLGWIEICHAVGSFCAHVTAAIVLSMFASIAHLVIVLLQIISMHNRQ